MRDRNSVCDDAMTASRTLDIDVVLTDGCVAIDGWVSRPGLRSDDVDANKLQEIVYKISR